MGGNRKVWVRVPGSCGNLGSGFDVVAAAIELYFELEIEVTPKAQQPMLKSGDLIADTAWPILKKAFPGQGFIIKAKSQIPMARGLGSSAAARVAALAAAYLLSKGEEGLKSVVGQAARLEGHGDNVAAAFYGGCCTSWRDGETFHCYSQKVPTSLAAVLAIPEFELPTKKARQALPLKIPHEDAVFNLSRLAALLAAFAAKKPEWLRQGLEDRLHQPYRTRLIPGLSRVINVAVKTGAAGACLSGSGSSVLAIAEVKADIVAIAQAMQKAFAASGIKSERKILAFNNKGIEWKLS